MYLELLGESGRKVLLYNAKVNLMSYRSGVITITETSEMCACINFNAFTMKHAAVRYSSPKNAFVINRLIVFNRLIFYKLYYFIRPLRSSKDHHLNPC